MKPISFTSSLPSELLQTLEGYAKQFKMPKNRIIELALKSYFEQLKKAEYAHSFRLASSDKDQKLMVEEGMEEYLKIISDYETR